MNSEGYLSFTNSQFGWMMRQAGLLTKREMAVLMGVIRYTHGYRRTDAMLSGTYLSAATGIKSQHVPAAVKKLSDKGIIQILPKQRNTNVLRFDWSLVLDSSQNGNKNTPEMGVSDSQDTPETGGEVLPNQEENPSQNGSETPPELGDNTMQDNKEKQYRDTGGDAGLEDDDDYYEFIF